MNQKFFILIDESTDISTVQVLAVVVRYFDSKKDDFVDTLLDSIIVETGTASGLYDAVKLLLRRKNIPIENIIGFGSDNCSSMMGKKSGFQKLLKNDVPNVFLMGCVCHSFALCASHAVHVLPSYLKAFLKNFATYFSRSSKRQRDFTLIQETIKSPGNKIPKLSQTRWLSSEKVVSVILNQYSALLLYLQSETKIDKVDDASELFKVLRDNETKPMLMFLQYVLQKVNKMNTEFQSEHFSLHLLHSMVFSEYRNILSCFIKEEVLHMFEVDDIDINQESNYKKSSYIYLGGKASAHLIKEPLVPRLRID